MAERELLFRTPPRPAPALGRAVCSLRPAYSETPLEPLQARIRRVDFDIPRLRRYLQCCGFADRTDRIPLTYPHVLAAGLHLRLMLHPAFPVKPAGLIHLENRIEQFTQLQTGTAYQLRAVLRDAGTQNRGRVFELATYLSDAGQDVWHERCIFLARAPVSGERPARQSADTGAPEGFGRGETISLASGTGRKYARVSGDWNPIHLYPFSARPFGFRRPIAHGMFLQARVLAALEARSLSARYCAIRFRRPVFLPGTVCLRSRKTAPAAAEFRLDNPAGGPYAEGTAGF